MLSAIVSGNSAASGKLPADSNKKGRMMIAPDLKRAVVIRRPWSIVHRWRTRDNRHAIECSHILYGSAASEPYRDVFRVLEFDSLGCTIVSQHRKRAAAVRALGKLLRK